MKTKRENIYQNATIWKKNVHCTGGPRILWYYTAALFSFLFIISFANQSTSPFWVSFKTFLFKKAFKQSLQVNIIRFFFKSKSSAVVDVHWKLYRMTLAKIFHWCVQLLYLSCVYILATFLCFFFVSWLINCYLLNLTWIKQKVNFYVTLLWS